MKTGLNNTISLNKILHPSFHGVFCFDYRNLEYDFFYDVLNDEERERAGRFKDERARQRMVFAHGLKRFLLGRLLGLSPGTLRFASHSHGKPYCLETTAPYFNISHSGNWVVLIFSTLGEVGVDLEFPGTFSFWDITGEVLSTEESSRLSTSSTWQDFLFYWTQKEALGKACGLGLGLKLPKISVSGSEPMQEIFLQNGRYLLQSLPWEDDGVLSIASTTPKNFKVYTLLDWENDRYCQFFPQLHHEGVAG